MHGQCWSCSLLEYYQRKAFGEFLDGSRLFLYKVTRNLLGWTGDDGAYLRTTMKAMALFGVPPESYWPYMEDRFNDEPPAFVYSLAQNFQSIKYYRLDHPTLSRDRVLETVKNKLATKLPSMFGFSVFSSIPGIGAGTGDIPFPAKHDKLVGGHAVVAVGYDDDKTIGEEKGALLIRNSWSNEWGENGYGWLPYRYVLTGMADDFWSLVRAEYIGTALFE